MPCAVSVTGNSALSGLTSRMPEYIVLQGLGERTVKPAECGRPGRKTHEQNTIHDQIFARHRLLLMTFRRFAQPTTHPAGTACLA